MASSSINVLKINKLSFNLPLIQGPLAGVSCAPFRALFANYRLPAYCVSEMISASEIVNQPQRLKRYLARNEKEGTLCYQISGHEPKTLARASQILEDLGAKRHVRLFKQSPSVQTVTVGSLKAY